MDKNRIESLIFTVLTNRPDEVECVDSDDEGIQVYLTNGEHFTVKVSKKMTQQDAEDLYEDWQDDNMCSGEGPDDCRPLRDLSAEELAFLSAVVEQDRLEDLRWDYSGRGMYGRSTLAVVGEAFSCAGLSLAMDSMGLGVVTYVR